MRIMKIFLAMLAFAALSPLHATAQPASLVAPGAATFSHVDLLVTDINANLKFWIAMGGMPTSWPGGAVGVTYGNVGIVLRHADAPLPAAGSGLNHFGLYVPDIAAAVARWKDMGFAVTLGHPGQAFVWSPGNLINVELLEMPGQVAPEVFHHLHYFVTPNGAGAIPEMQAWYAHLFAATPGHRAQFDNDTLPGGELSFAKSAAPTAPSAGRAIDHVAFAITGLEEFCGKLQAEGIKLDMPYAKHPELGLATAFLTDPWGNRIELDEALPAEPKAPSPPHIRRSRPRR